MLCQLLCCDSRTRVNIEYSSEQVSNFVIANIRRHGCVFAILNFSEKVRFKFTEERKLTHVNDVKDDTTGPHVCGSAIVGLLTNQVWVHIVWRPTEDRQFFLLSHSQTETEIDYFNVFGADIHQNIVQFQIAMCVAL